jgi:hypothetical protein
LSIERNDIEGVRICFSIPARYISNTNTSINSKIYSKAG